MLRSTLSRGLRATALGPLRVLPADVRAVSSVGPSPLPSRSPTSSAAITTSATSPILPRGLPSRGPLPARASPALASALASIGAPLPSRALAASLATSASMRPLSTSPFAATRPLAFFRSRRGAGSQDPAPHPSNERVIDVDNPVFVDKPPFNVFYMHHSTWVIPLDPQSVGKSPVAMYLTLLGLCGAVWWMWQMALIPPPRADGGAITTTELNELMSGEGTSKDQLLELVRKIPTGDLNAISKKMDMMTDNFAVNSDSLVHRPWTMFTSALSHQSLGHLGSNFISLFLFAPKVYSFLGPRYFTGLYLAGAAGCSLMHCGLNWITGHREKPFGFADTVALSLRLDEDDFAKVAAKQDVPLLGASGSCMAVSAACAMLFPRDHIFMRLTYVPVPLAVALYAAIDLSAVLNPASSSGGSEESSIGHAGHVGGTIAGAAYIKYIWDKVKVHGQTPRQRFGTTIPLLAMLLKKAPNPIAFIAGKGGPGPMRK